MAGGGSVRQPIRLIALAAALGAASLSFSVASAMAAPVVTAECPGPTTTGDGVTANARLAQTFTAQVTGTLVQGEIEVNKPAPGGDWVMEIYATDGAGNPTNSLLASTTISDAGVPLGDVRLVGIFSTSLVIQAGQQYAISLRRSSSWVGLVRDDNPCEGRVFVSSTPSGAWTDSAGPAIDFVFAVRVEPGAEPAPPEPGAKADGTLTIDANKGKVEKGRKVTLTGQLDVATNEGCEPGRAVEIQRRLKSQDNSKFATFKTVQTDATGNYSLRVKVRKTYFYRAIVGETDACDDETSNSQKVRVQKKKAAQEA